MRENTDAFDELWVVAESRTNKKAANKTYLVAAQPRTRFETKDYQCADKVDNVQKEVLFMM